MRDVMLIGHFIGLAMGLGTSFAFLFLRGAASKLDKEEATKFMLNAFALTRMGNIGLAILFITGGYLMTPYWSQLGSMHTLITKLVLFLALGAVLGIIGSKAKKAKKGVDVEGQMNKIKTLGKVAMVIALTIVVMAVLTFH